MKLMTKLKWAYIFLVILLILVTGGSIAGITALSVNALGKQYDVSDSAGYDVLYNPFKLLGNVASSVVNEMNQTIKSNPQKMEDVTYLQELNTKLCEQSSYLIVKKNEDIIYSGSADTDWPEINEAYLSIDAKSSNIFVMNQEPYHLCQREFSFDDGSVGEYFVITNIENVVPRIRKTFIQLFLVIIGIFVVSGILEMWWLYKSVIGPVNRLKKASENIKEGNLDFTVDVQTNDEIGELCISFEEMRRKLKEQIEISMQYEKDNKELISNISHDLKTPVTAIKGYIEGILDGVADTPEKQERYIRTIYAKTNDMQKLIEELFLYSKLDSNAVNYSFQKVNLSDYFEDCIEEISVDLESKKIGLGFFNYVDKNCIIIADPEQLKRVIINIVSNSAKYIDKPNGLINIRLNDEPEYVQVEIEDNGQGISSEELPHIFERCYRTDASRNSAQGGSGLGLSIAKKIIEEHGGRIWATSKVGIGTTISFVIRKYEEKVNE